MPWYGCLLLLAVVLLTAGLWVGVNRKKRGPSRCIGCGKCDSTGVCARNRKTVEKKRDSL